MSVHLQREILNLKQLVIQLSARVEENLSLAVKAVKERDDASAQKVIENDLDIDAREVGVEEECLKILALHQPVATDLRFIVSALKLNNDLERIGDLAVNIAKCAAQLSRELPVPIPYDLQQMADRTRDMLKKSLDALVNMEASLANEVCKDDEVIDQINSDSFQKVEKAIIDQKPENLHALIYLLSVSRHLERIADHATNIAEDVIYMVEGKIVRHKDQVE